MTVVSDTTVLIALARIGQFELLRRLWGRIIIPERVYEEVGRGATGRPETLAAASAGWVAVREVQDRKSVAMLAGSLGREEAECLVLAGEVDADLLLLDDRRARTAAERAGFQVIGTLGALVLAAKRGLLDPGEVPAMIDVLRRTQFRLGEKVVRKALEDLGIRE